MLRIEHETRLTYSEPVSETVIELRMAPPSTEDQTVLGYRLKATPPATPTPYRDGFGNRVELLNVLTAHKEVVLRTTSYVRAHRRPGDKRLDIPKSAAHTGALEALEFVQPSPLAGQCPEIDELAAPLRGTEGTVGEMVQRVMQVVRDRLKYEKKVTDARTPVGEVLRLGRGVCQDFAHLMIAVCRSLGHPARYVSGYIHQPGEIATHAWCQVWAGETGWVDVDPTHGVIVADEHVVTAVGRDYGDTPPSRGVWKGIGTETMAVTVKVDAVERMPGDWADVSVHGQLSLAAAAHRLVRVNGAGYRANVRLLYRHQQEQQQQFAKAHV